MKESIGFAGCGNMGCGILRGILRKRLVSKKEIVAFDKDPEKMRNLQKFFGVRQADSLKALVQRSKIIILAVKPQQFQEAASEIKPHLKKGQVVISILAGTTLSSLRKYLGTAPRLVRIMPNLGALVGEAASAISGSDERSLQRAELIFKACGEVVRVKEPLMDLVTAVSGSGPAYFFLLMERLEQEAVRGGIDPASARKLAIHTALGSARLAAETHHSPGALRSMVTSKGGTTEEALEVFHQYGFDEMIAEAVEKAAQRAKELAE